MTLLNNWSKQILCCTLKKCWTSGI